MPKIMLIDAAQPEETRVAVMDGKRLDNFDIESASKKQLKGNIYLAKVTRVEPSLQAAFVSYGGNRHGFLPFSEIHPDYYRIPVEDRERLLAEQEELSRQLQQEAQAREEREIVEAEALAQRIAAGEEPEAIAEDAEADFNDDVELTPPTEAEMAEAEARADAAEQAEDARDEAQAQADAEGDDLNAADDADAGDDADNDNEQDSADEGAVDSEGNPVAAAEGTAEGEQPRRGGRGRGRRRGRGRGRGLERGKSDQLVDRESGREGGRSEGGRSEGEDEETAMTPLWKRMHRNYKIQEVIKRGQIMLIQVVKEERGNKGAAVTSYITMPGRYCVLMPNSPQSGGVSRKVASHSDRRKMRDLLDELQVPGGMSVILRTAGVDRAPEEIKRDLDYLMRLWDKVRDTTMQSTAPALIHEEGSLVKRAIRDLYTKEIGEIVVEGAEGAKVAREVMSMMMSDHANNVREYKDTVPLFIKYGAEPQIDAIHSNTVTLRSGGYLVINPTEALVSIDINSGRATRERHIEETAVKTNLEAADEIARQLRLRDLGGLVVIDFIDMENRRNNAMVEKRMRDALSTDRARVQVGRISSFGLMELSRQRLRPSLTETHFHTCPHCRGLGIVRTTEAMVLAVLRAIETVGMENRASELQITVTEPVATFLFNAKRASLAMLEARYDLSVLINLAHEIDDDQGFILEVGRSRRAERLGAVDAVVEADLAEDDADMDAHDEQPRQNVSGDAEGAPRAPRNAEEGEDGARRGRRRGRRGGRNRFREGRDGEARDNNVEGNVIDTEAPEIDDNIGNRKSADDDSDMEANIGNGGQPRAERTDADGKSRRGRRGRGGRGGAGREGGAPRDGNAQPREPREGNRGGRERTPGAGNRENVPASNGNRFESDGNTQPPVPAAPSAPREREPQAARAYEVVNEAPGEKKKGWWKKLTG